MAGSLNTGNVELDNNRQFYDANFSQGPEAAFTAQDSGARYLTAIEGFDKSVQPALQQLEANTMFLVEDLDDETLVALHAMPPEKQQQLLDRVEAEVAHISQNKEPCPHAFELLCRCIDTFLLPEAQAMKDRHSSETHRLEQALMGFGPSFRRQFKDMHDRGLFRLHELSDSSLAFVRGLSNHQLEELLVRLKAESRVCKVKLRHSAAYMPSAEAMLARVTNGLGSAAQIVQSQAALASARLRRALAGFEPSVRKRLRQLADSGLWHVHHLSNENLERLQALPPSAHHLLLDKLTGQIHEARLQQGSSGRASTPRSANALFNDVMATHMQHITSATASGGGGGSQLKHALVGFDPTVRRRLHTFAQLRLFSVQQLSPASLSALHGMSSAEQHALLDRVEAEVQRRQADAGGRHVALPNASEMLALLAQNAVMNPPSQRVPSHMRTDPMWLTPDPDAIGGGGGGGGSGDATVNRNSSTIAYDVRGLKTTTTTTTTTYQRGSGGGSGGGGGGGGGSMYYGSPNTMQSALRVTTNNGNGSGGGGGGGALVSSSASGLAWSPHRGGAEWEGCEPAVVSRLRALSEKGWWTLRAVTATARGTFLRMHPRDQHLLLDKMEEELHDIHARYAKPPSAMDLFTRCVPTHQGVFADIDLVLRGFASASTRATLRSLYDTAMWRVNELTERATQKLQAMSQEQQRLFLDKLSAELYHLQATHTFNHQSLPSAMEMCARVSQTLQNTTTAAAAASAALGVGGSGGGGGGGVAAVGSPAGSASHLRHALLGFDSDVRRRLRSLAGDGTFAVHTLSADELTRLHALDAKEQLLLVERIEHEVELLRSQIDQGLAPTGAPMANSYSGTAMPNASQILAAVSAAAAAAGGAGITDGTTRQAVLRRSGDGPLLRVSLKSFDPTIRRRFRELDHAGLWCVHDLNKAGFRYIQSLTPRDLHILLRHITTQLQREKEAARDGQPLPSALDLLMAVTGKQFDGGSFSDEEDAACNNATNSEAVAHVTSSLAHATIHRSLARFPPPVRRRLREMAHREAWSVHALTQPSFQLLQGMGERQQHELLDKIVVRVKEFRQANPGQPLPTHEALFLTASGLEQKRQQQATEAQAVSASSGDALFQEAQRHWDNQRQVQLRAQLGAGGATAGGFSLSAGNAALSPGLSVGAASGMAGIGGIGGLGSISGFGGSSSNLVLGGGMTVAGGGGGSVARKQIAAGGGKGGGSTPIAGATGTAALGKYNDRGPAGDRKRYGGYKAPTGATHGHTHHHHHHAHGAAGHRHHHHHKHRAKGEVVREATTTF